MSLYKEVYSAYDTLPLPHYELLIVGPHNVQCLWTTGWLQMTWRELQSLLADPYLEVTVHLTGVPGEQRRTQSQRASAMADNSNEPAVTTEWLQRVQHLESCL